MKYSSKKVFTNEKYIKTTIISKIRKAENRYPLSSPESLEMFSLLEFLYSAIKEAKYTQVIAPRP